MYFVQGTLNYRYGPAGCQMLSPSFPGSTPLSPRTSAKGDFDWVPNAFTIVSWFYTSISPDIFQFQIVHTKNGTAHSLWQAILSSSTTRRWALCISDSQCEFSNMDQGAMPILMYMY